MREHIMKLAMITGLNLIVYYKSLFFGYVGDDVERSERKTPVFKNTFHRWWIQFIGLRHINSMVSHFISLWTHIICCWFIYLYPDTFFPDAGASHCGAKNPGGGSDDLRNKLLHRIQKRIDLSIIIVYVS